MPEEGSLLPLLNGNARRRLFASLAECPGRIHTPCPLTGCAACPAHFCPPWAPTWSPWLSVFAVAKHLPPTAAALSRLAGLLHCSGGFCLVPCCPTCTPAAAAAGLRTTSTIMFGHCEEEGPASWARHLLTLREVQRQACSGSSRSGGGGGGGGGISEFVPLPFVHMEAPIYLKGACAWEARKHKGIREEIRCGRGHAAFFVLGVFQTPSGCALESCCWLHIAACAAARTSDCVCSTAPRSCLLPPGLPVKAVPLCFALLCERAGRARRGPTLRECVLMHAVARLALHPHITNIQASWVKMGPHQAAQLLAGKWPQGPACFTALSLQRATCASLHAEVMP